MERNIFNKIDLKLVEIMEMIEHEKNFPLLARDVKNYTFGSEERERLCAIYMEVSALRSI